ncbi:MAG: iron-containing redox enzyme family protein, partial [Duganella sp.]
VIRHHAADSGGDDGDVGELRQLELRVAAMGNKQAAMRLLQSLMTPARHHGAVGLMATRLFRQLID